MFRKSLMVVGVVGLLGITVAAATPGADAAGGWKPGKFAQTPLGKLITGNLGRMMVLRSELDITEAQRAQIKEVLVAHKSEIAKHAKAVRDKRVALRDAVLADNPSDAKIRKAADELGKVVGNAAVKAAKLKGKIAPILTEEQREKIAEFRADRDEAVESFFEKIIKE